MAQPPVLNYANYPLKDVPHPHPHDVLCGRGGGTNSHVGNAHWRMLVAANKQLYITLPKRQKMLLSRSIVNAVRSQNPPGRFLAKDSKSNLWFDVGDQRAQEKTSQALREGAPDIRKKVAAQKGGTASTEDGDDVESTGDISTEDPGDSEEPAEKAPPPLPSEEIKRSQAEHEPERSTNGTKPMPPSKPSAAQKAAPVGPHGGPPVQVPSGMMAPQHYMAPPGMAYHGMPIQQMPGGQMMYYAGPNMAPVRVYPTMVLNEHGMMVPAMSVVPPMMAPHMMPPHQMAQMPPHMQYAPPPPHQANAQVSAAGSEVTAPTRNNSEKQRRAERASRPVKRRSANDDQESGDNFEPLPHDSNDKDYSAFSGHLPSFEDATCHPPTMEPGSHSFGSITMTDVEQVRLQGQGPSYGSGMRRHHVRSHHGWYN